MQTAIDKERRVAIVAPYFAHQGSLEAILAHSPELFDRISGTAGYRAAREIQTRIMIVRHPVDRWLMIRSDIQRRLPISDNAFLEEWLAAPSTMAMKESCVDVAQIVDPTLVLRHEECAVAQVQGFLSRTYGIELPKPSRDIRSHKLGASDVPVESILTVWGNDYAAYYSLFGYRRDGTRAA